MKTMTAAFLALVFVSFSAHAQPQNCARWLEVKPIDYSVDVDDKRHRSLVELGYNSEYAKQKIGQTQGWRSSAVTTSSVVLLNLLTSLKGKPNPTKSFSEFSPALKYSLSQLSAKYLLEKQNSSELAHRYRSNPLPALLYLAKLNLDNNPGAQWNLGHLVNYYLSLDRNDFDLTGYYRNNRSPLGIKIQNALEVSAPYWLAET